jgi:hypothetical protein
MRKDTVGERGFIFHLRGFRSPVMSAAVDLAFSVEVHLGTIAFAGLLVVE